MGSEYLLKAHENSGMGYQSLDHEGRIIEANELWCSMLGYTIDEVTGRWFGDFLSEKSRANFIAAFPIFKEEGMVNDVRMELVHKNGSIIEMVIDGKATFSTEGEFERTHCICRLADSGFSLSSTYQNPVNRTDIPVIVFDVENLNLVDVNQAASKFYGYSYKEFLAMSMADINVMPLENIREKLNDALNGGKVNFRIEHVLSDGSVRIVEPKPTKLVYGDKVYMLVLIIDVTDEVFKEKRLTALLDLSKKLLEPDISIKEIAETVLSSAQDLTKSKDGYVATVDRVTKELVIHTFTDMMDSCRVQHKDVKFKQNADGKYPALFGHSLNTLENFYTNNPAAHMESTGIPAGHIEINNALFFPVTIQNELVGQIALANCSSGFTDEDMQIVKEIATIYAIAIKGYEHSAEEYKFQEIFNSIVEGILILKPEKEGEEFTLMDLNRAAVGITGLNYYKARGRKLTDVLPALDIELHKTLVSVAKSGVPARLGLRTYKDERVLFISDSYIFRMPTGYVVLIFRDLTELHAIQKELKDLNEKLRDKVEYELGIRRKQEQVIQEQKKLADLGHMINAIAHQWRQPINVLGLYSQEVVDLYNDDRLTREFMEEYYKNSMDMVNHLSSTIDDFRYFFKSEKEKIEFEVVREVLNLVKLVKVQLNTFGIKVRVSCECTYKGLYCVDLEEKPECECKASKITGFKGEFRQVMMNLINNASDAIRENMEAGNIGSGLLVIHIICTEKTVSVSVSDNGSGVPVEIIDQIFNPYFTTKEEGRGTGIGLYMSKIVIEEHMDGDLSVENDDGAVFTVKLPKN